MPCAVFLTSVDNRGVLLYRKANHLTIAARDCGDQLIKGIMQRKYALTEVLKESISYNELF